MPAYVATIPSIRRMCEFWLSRGWLVQKRGHWIYDHRCDGFGWQLKSTAVCVCVLSKWQRKKCVQCTRSRAHAHTSITVRSFKPFYQLYRCVGSIDVSSCSIPAAADSFHVNLFFGIAVASFMRSYAAHHAAAAAAAFSTMFFFCRCACVFIFS